MKKFLVISFTAFAVSFFIFGTAMWVLGEISNTQAGLIWLNVPTSIKLFNKLYRF